MQLFRRESLAVDTRASPTPPPEPTNSAIHGMLIGEDSTFSIATKPGNVLRPSKTFSNTSRTSITVQTSIPSPTGISDLSTLSGDAILCICLGSIAFVLLSLLVLILCKKLRKSEKKAKEKFTMRT
jgi:hypothetical protein